MTLDLTPEQAKAIDTRDVSIALSAGAGCGKTLVLTQRFLAHLDPRDAAGARPADLGELVAITFTDRAAREMRDRIRRQCYERLIAATGEESDYWLALLRALDRARVGTIHSFCASLLRAHAVEARLDPQFGVLDAAQQQTLAAEVVDDAFRAGLARGDERVLGLVSQCGLERLRAFLLELLGQRPLPQLEHWLAASPEEQVAAWKEFHRAQVVPAVLERVQNAPVAQRVLEILRHAPSGDPVLAERRALLVGLLPRLIESGDPAGDLHAIREAAKVTGLKKKLWDEELYAQYKEAAEKLRKEIDGRASLLAFDAQAALPAAEVGLQLLRLLVGVIEAYDARKAELVLLDFDDLISRATQLLTDPQHAGLRRAVASRIRLLLVDEFQDTDPLQVALVEALCDGELGAGRLFVVGDFKQSIYRFRGADPHVFRRVQQAIPERGRMPLTLNFRSQGAILDFVNALFCDAFEPRQPLRPHRGQTTPLPAVEFLWAPDDGSQLAKGKAEAMRRREADWIARRLRALIDSGAPIIGDETAPDDEPAARPLRPGDVAILFRALSDVHLYEDTLRNYGLDYYLVGGHAFYSQQEVFDLLNLLRALANPDDEVSLAGVLRSPFFALSDEALFWLAQHEDGLAAGLFAPRLDARLDDESRRRVAAAAHLLAELRQRKDRLPLAELIEEAVARTGYDAALLAEFLGERKLANLRKLVDQARSFTASGAFGLADFIVELAQFVAAQPKEPLAATHPESTDVVRLMTIHQAKGLEFPLVVVPDLERTGSGRSVPVRYSAELGPLVRHDANLPLCGLDLQDQIERREDDEELVRLFYVATTRAADYLILSSGIYDLEKPRGAWTRLLAQRFDLQTGALAATLPKGYTVPQIHVTLEEPPTDQAAQSRPRGADLGKLVKEAAALAARGAGETFVTTAAVPPDLAARRQWSFSRLTGRLRAAASITDDETELPQPQPPGEPDLASTDPLALGVLVHAMLEQVYCDRASGAALAGAATSAKQITALAERLAPRWFDQPDPAAAEAAEMVGRFLASPRAAALAGAAQLYTELEFLLAWPPGAAEPDGRYLQGVIDCLYQDAAGRWHVLDYKTNVVEAGRTLAQIAAGYQMQLYVYALAVEQVLGTPPGSLVLHFLRTGQEVVFDWNDDARHRVISRVSQAIGLA